MMRITAVARGEVQGVGYRSFVTGCARASGVAGYVKNEPDGSVLMVAEGERAALDAFVRMIKAEGDALIRVDSLSVTTGEANGEFAGFREGNPPQHIPPPAAPPQSQCTKPPLHARASSGCQKKSGVRS